MYKYEKDKYMTDVEKQYYSSESVGALHPDRRDKRFISLMSSMSHTYGNVLAWIQKTVLDIMPEDLFKTIHVNSKIAHRQIKETSHQYLKKARPMIIFRPRIGDPDEDRFLKGTALVERQYNIFNTWGATNLQPFIEDPQHDLMVNYQQNRSVMYVDVVMVFSTLMNQMDYVHYLENAIPWNSPQQIKTCVESYIPQEMLKLVSDISGVPMYDSNGSTYDFLKYLEGNSQCPVTYKLQGSSGTREFYRFYPTSIDTTFSNLSWDDGEKVGHIMNSYQISFSIRMEFFSTGFYYIFSDNIYDYKLPKINPEEDKLIPVFTDVLTREDLNLAPGWHLYSKASCRLDIGEEKVNISEMFNASIKACYDYHIKNHLPLSEFLDIKIRKQGKLLHAGIDYVIDYETLDVYFKDTNSYFTYRILICVNVEYVNDIAKQIYDLK